MSRRTEVVVIILFGVGFGLLPNRASRRTNGEKLCQTLMPERLPLPEAQSRQPLSTSSTTRVSLI